MYNNYNYLIPEERQVWRSAYEIEIAALKHENRRIQLESEETPFVTPRAQTETNPKMGLMSLLKASLQMMFVLFG